MFKFKIPQQTQLVYEKSYISMHIHISIYAHHIHVCIYTYINIHETSQDQMRLKSETFISSYRQKMTWKSFSGRFKFVGFAYTNSKFIQL